jgi:AcrR family transcriptional regulator
MAETKKTRLPQQQRSIDKKKKILDAAYEVFCTKGFYKTTTIEIARRAGVSIGSLYSYFADKNDLFTAILDRYDSEFDALRVRALEPVDGTPRSHAKLIRSIMTALLEEHEASRELNREIKMLSFSDPAIAARMERQAVKIRQAVRTYLTANREALRPFDLDAATVVVWKTISSLVDGIVFEPQTIDRQRIIDATVDALCAYLVK